MDCPICFESIIKQHKFRCNHYVCKPCFRNMSKKGQTMVYEIVYDTTFIQYETNRIQ
jgi:transposase-like protein